MATNITVVDVSQPQNVTGPHLDPVTCHRHALFLSFITNTFSLFALWFLFAVISAIFTTSLVKIVDPSPPKPPDAPVPDTATATATVEVEATAIPAPPSEEQHNEEDLPPYEPAAAVPIQPPPNVPVATETPPVAVEPEVEAKPKPKRSSAHNFVLGSSLLLPTMLSYLLAILCIQSILYCSPTFILASRGDHIAVWIICFALPSIWVSMSVLCWVILLLDLWGPGMRKRVPIPYYIVPWSLLLAVMFPFVLVFKTVFGLAKLLVMAVESCQRRFCEDALIEEREEDIELAAGQPRMETLNEVGEGSSAGAAEETVGLMADTKT
jgi:hypothetical protein